MSKANSIRIYSWYFCFGRVGLVKTSDVQHPDYRPYVRTREQAAALVRLGAKKMTSKGVVA